MKIPKTRKENTNENKKLKQLQKNLTTKRTSVHSVSHTIFRITAKTKLPKNISNRFSERVHIIFTSTGETRVEEKQRLAWMKPFTTSCHRMRNWAPRTNCVWSQTGVAEERAVIRRSMPLNADINKQVYNNTIPKYSKQERKKSLHTKRLKGNTCELQHGDTLSFCEVQVGGKKSLQGKNRQPSNMDSVMSLMSPNPSLGLKTGDWGTMPASE